MGEGSTAGAIVLVHGGFVDGSGWQGVYDQLESDGYRVSVVQNPTISLEGDAAATRQDGFLLLATAPPMSHVIRVRIAQFYAAFAQRTST